MGNFNVVLIIIIVVLFSIGALTIGSIWGVIEWVKGPTTIKSKTLITPEMHITCIDGVCDTTYIYTEPK